MTTVLSQDEAEMLERFRACTGSHQEIISRRVDADSSYTGPFRDYPDLNPGEAALLDAYRKAEESLRAEVRQLLITLGGSPAL